VQNCRLPQLGELLVLGHLLSTLSTTRPGMTVLSRAIVEAILLSEGSIGPASSVARTLGLPNRFSLARVLRHDGLPAMHRFAEWATVLSWVVTAEQERVSLSWIAFHSQRYPSACYRQVRKVTGMRWEEVRLRGSRWVEQKLLALVRRSGRSS
jgi:hypothetical protein